MYKGQDKLENRPVAIKILHTYSAASDQTVRRFEQECKTLSLLKHKNIVSLYDSGVTEQDQPYLVMEFLDGQSLKQLIDSKGALDVNEVLAIGVQACSGMEAAHERALCTAI